VLERYSDLDKLFGSMIDRTNMKLGSKFLNFMRIKTQLFKRLQHVIVVDGVTYSQKDGVEGGNGGSLKDAAEAGLCVVLPARRSAGSVV